MNLNILLILENGPWGTLYINSITDKGAHLIAALIHRSLGFIGAGLAFVLCEVSCVGFSPFSGGLEEGDISFSSSIVARSGSSCKCAVLTE